MSVPDSLPFPIAGFQVIVNAENEWVALSLHLPLEGTDTAAALAALFGQEDVFQAIAPLACVIALADPHPLPSSTLELLPAERTVFRISPSACAATQEQYDRMAGAGYRILSDCASAAQVDGRGTTFDCAPLGLPAGIVRALPGPHLARNVGSGAQLAACRAAGFTWFSGSFSLLPARIGASVEDGTSRKRLLALLGLLARDADSRELEMLLKQDPALSYHLLKLVNSAALTLSAPIRSFGQAINLLGRRQLRRWLQLLLYARQGDGVANPLLPIAAMRAAQMEALCRSKQGDQDQQEIAYMAGMFSLLDVLLDMPMGDVLSALSLDPDVVMALLERSGPLGQLLALVESGVATPAALNNIGIGPATYWHSLLHAYHCAIEVSRNL